MLDRKIYICAFSHERKGICEVLIKANYTYLPELLHYFHFIPNIFNFGKLLPIFNSIINIILINNYKFE